MLLRSFTHIKRRAQTEAVRKWRAFIWAPTSVSSLKYLCCNVRKVGSEIEDGGAAYSWKDILVECGTTVGMSNVRAVAMKETSSSEN